jgi:hypothetical protein
MSASVHRYEIFGEIVEFVDCDAVAQEFRGILRGWDMRPLPDAATREAYLRFEKAGRIYRWNAPWISERTAERREDCETVADAVCDFHYEFIDWYADRHPQSFCVHMAAVAFARGAVLFPAVQKAGKTTLSLHLAKRGHALIGDDVVAIEAEALRAKALGLLPRTRLPLPGKVFVDLDYGRFIADGSAICDTNWQYVALPDGAVSPLGSQHPVCAVILLDRRRAGPPSLTPVSRGSALKAMIDRNFGIVNRPRFIFDRLKQLVSTSDCLRLQYSHAGEAADLLSEIYGRSDPACGAQS